MKNQIVSAAVQTKNWACENKKTLLLVALALTPALAMAAEADAPQFTNAGLGDAFKELTDKFGDLYLAAEGAITGTPGKAFTGISVLIGVASAMGGRTMTAIGALALGLVCQLIPVGMNFLFSATL